MEKKEENLENAKECKKVCKEFKKIIINFLKEWGIVIIMILGFSIMTITYLNYYYDYSETVYSNNSQGSKTKIVESLGQAGDFLGGTLNPIFAFLSFCLLLITIKIQNKSLETSQEELRLTRKELKKSSTAQQDQSNSIRLQNFETTFFNMISLHNQIVNNIMLKTHSIKYDSKIEHISGYPNVKKMKFDLINKSSLKNEDIIIGKNAIKEICNKIDDFIENTTLPNTGTNTKINKNRKPTSIYDLIYQCYSDIVGHYFGNIYQILKHISTSEDTIDKRKYSDLFRAQFSSQELKLLFYHCSASIGSKELKAYIEEFEFLEHLNIEKENEFYKYVFYRCIYNLKAFGIKNKYKIETLSSEIQDKINKEIQDKINGEVGSPLDKKNNQDKYKYKYLDYYKYFSKEELEQYLLLLKEDSPCNLNNISIELAVLDYSKEDDSKNYELTISSSQEPQ